MAGTAYILGPIYAEQIADETGGNPLDTSLLVSITSTNTLTNKSFSDATTYFIDDSDGTKKVQLQVSSVPTSTTQVWTFPSADGNADTFVGLTTSQTLTNKTLTTPIISSISNTGTITLPTSTDTLVGRATTDTLTNKTLTSAILTTPQINDATATNKYLLAVSELAADRTITLPLLTAGDTFVFADFTQTLTNKTLSTGSTWSGTAISASRGGTGQDFSASTGAISVSGGTFSAGTLAVTNGGTGIATLVASYIPYGNGTGAFQSSSNFTYDGTDLTVASGHVISSAAPTLTTHLTNKSYVDSVASGLDVKASVRLATTADLDTNAATNGISGTITYNSTGGTSGRGQITATLSVSDTFVIDSVTLGAANDGTRILLKDQTTGAQNGIWTTVISGTSLTLNRATDFDEDAEVTAGAFTFIAEGTVNGDTGWTLTTNDPITIGGVSGTALSFSQFSGAGNITAGNGLDKVGSELSVDLKANGGLVIETTELAVDLSASAITGTLAVGDGGTGLTTFAQYDIIYASAANTLSALTTATNSVLATNGSGAPAYTATLPSAVQGNITSVGTIASGTWQGSAIADTYVSNTLTITGGSIDGTAIGGTTPAAGAFTTLTSSADITLLDPTNDGNPTATIGATGSEALVITSSYATGTQTLEFVEFRTKTASVTANYGEMRFIIDDTNLTFTINDSSIGISGAASTIKIDTADVLSKTTLGSTVINSSLTSVGTIATGVWNGTAIGGAYGGTGLSTFTGANYILYSTSTTALAASQTLPSAVQGNITTVGTIASGTWNGTAVGVAYGGTGLSSFTGANYILYSTGTTTLAETQTLPSAVQGNITTVGTIATGVWQGTAIADTYVANDLTISGGTINSSIIGGSTPAAGTFTTLTGATVNATADITLLDPTNDGNPTVTIGATALEAIVITSVYDAVAQTLDKVTFTTKAASATADKGKMEFYVDEALITTIDDSSVNLATGKTYRINSTDVLSATVLGSNVVTSSLTTVGTIGTGVWQGTAVGVAYGGTGQTTYTAGQILIGTSAGSLTKAILTDGSNIVITEGDGSITIATSTTPSFTTVTVGNTGLVVGTSTPFSDATGTLTLQNIDVIDNTTATTIEGTLNDLPLVAGVGTDAGTTTLDIGTTTSTTAKTINIGTGGTGTVNINLGNSTAGTVTFNGATSVPTPTSALHIANKSYVDSMASGLDIKESVRAGTIVDLDSNASISGVITYNATGGSSARGQITATLVTTDTFTIDGVTIASAGNGTRILIKAQTSGAQNGIWTTTVSGTSLTLDRATDFDQDAEVTSGAFCFIEEGTTLANTGWALTTDGTITIGGASGTVLTFTQFTGAGLLSAGTNIDITGNTVSTTASLTSITNITMSGTLSGATSVSATNLTGTLQTAAQTNITSVGTLTSLTVSGLTTTSTMKLSTGSGVTFTSAAQSGANTLNTRDLGAAVTDYIVTEALSQTLTNKTLTAPSISGITSFTAGGNLDIGPYDLHALTFTSDATTGTAPFTVASTTVVTNLNADTVDGIQGASIVTLTGTQTLTNKTLTTPIIATISNTGTLTLPTSTDTLVGRATTDTLTNKTLTAPIISTISNTGTLTLPTSTDTLVGRATTDTLTNKTLSDSTTIFAYVSDLTAKMKFQLSGITTATTRTLTVPNVDGTIITSGNLTGITTVGTITSGTWNGTVIGVAYGGTGLATVATDTILTGNGTAALTAETNLTYNTGTGLTVGSGDVIIGTNAIGTWTTTTIADADAETTITSHYASFTRTKLSVTFVFDFQVVTSASYTPAGTMVFTTSSTTLPTSATSASTTYVNAIQAVQDSPAGYIPSWVEITQAATGFTVRGSFLASKTYQIKGMITYPTS